MSNTRWVSMLLVVVGWSPSDGFILSINHDGFYQQQQQQQQQQQRLSSSLFHSFQSLSSSSPLSLEVYDNIMLPETCNILHQLAMEFSDRHDDEEEGNDSSSIFIRPPYNTNPLTPLELAMESILMKQPQSSSSSSSPAAAAAVIEETDNDTDTSNNHQRTIVEYWWRDEYMNLDLHSDIDETVFQDEGILSCPDTAHVLYLHVQPDLKGPTCVVSHFGGWNTMNHTAPVTTMVTVPAVQGRLLRFTGSAMHGVPKPMDRWLFSDEEEKQLRDMEKDEEMDCQTEDDEDDNDDDNKEEVEAISERSVLLFNCWSNHGPRGVTTDAIAGTFPEGIDFDEDAITYMAQQEQQQRDQWMKDFGPNGEGVLCQPRSEWIWNNIVDPLQIEEDDIALIRVSLMGNKRRRLYPKKHVKLIAPVKAFRRGVQEALTPTRFFLTHNDTP
jgi:hypothetical protein